MVARLNVVVLTFALFSHIVIGLGAKHYFWEISVSPMTSTEFLEIELENAL
jgi:hypothetical protein